MNRDDTVKDQKSRLRQTFRTRRDAAKATGVAEASEAICRRLEELDALAGAGRIAGYASLAGEIDVRPYLTTRLKRGVDVFLPRVTGPGTMEFCPISGWDDLEEGAFGILEPTGAAGDVESIEVFLVPGLAFDQRGNRLGFGKGFYDRALPPVGRAVAIGIGHHWQFIDQTLPVQSHDRPMDYVVTDRHCYTSGPSHPDDQE